jgi:hypothetical protein
MGCRSLDFAAVEADLGFAAIASGSGLRGGLRRSPSRLTVSLGFADLLPRLTVSLGFAVDSSSDVLLRQEPVLLI